MSRPSAPDLSERLAGLSPAKRELLERRLRERGAEALRSVSAIPRREDRGSAPVSFAQRRLWFLDQLEPGTSSYNVPRSLRLVGPLSEDALRRSLDALVERHEVLRTTFRPVDGEPVQVVGPGDPACFTSVELSGLGPEDREREVARIGREEESAPFDLERGPLFRARLLRLAGDDHVLYLTNHHIVSDAWSAGVLFRELAAFYDAFAAGEVPALPPLPIQYGDFAAWQRGAGQADVLASQLDYWKARLGDAPALLEIPADHARPAVQTVRGARETVILPPALSDRLLTFAQSEGGTPFMALLAIFAILLRRYTGREDIVVGSPIAGRTRPELEGLLGCFLNTLVLRCDLTGDPGFRELLGRVREVAVGAYSHQDMPFERLVEELKPERSLSHTPVFQVLFILQNAPAAVPELRGVRVVPMSPAITTSKFDLTLSATETADGLRVRAEYNVDLFEAATIRRMLGHFETLLASALREPDLAVSRLPMLTEAEERQLIDDWNSTAAPAPEEGSLPRMFEAQVRRTPAAIAAADDRDAWTYEELNSRANRFARLFREAGATRGALVAVCAERSPRSLAALLGILKAGAAYLPLDPAYPDERIRFMVEDAPVTAVVTDRDLAVRFGPAVPVIRLDGEVSPSEGYGGGDLEDAPGGDDLAYLIYTSGSTGRPKGVEIPHRALANFLGAMRRAPGLASNDVLLSVTTLSFDIAGLELYLPLVSGARVVIASRETASDPALLLGAIARHGVTVMQATPATWQLLVAGGWEKGAGPARALCGGEALPRDLAAAVLSRVDSLWNLYGPTETTIWSAAHRVTGRFETGVAPIGRPIMNTWFFVLDPQGGLVPIGVPGELFIGGAGVALGYWNRPDLTAERFVPDPFGTGGGVMYRTGDRVRYREDGTLDFLGRLDGQVKLRGFRIELGEVEAVLRDESSVGAAAVAMSPDGSGGQRLVAYVVPRNGTPPDPDALRRALAARLPAYMIPAAFVSLDRLPLTPNGKVDRRALAAIGHDWSASTAPFVGPSSETEVTLAAIWGGVLGLDRVGIEQSFFEAGGHSLLATQLISRVRHRFGIDLPLRALFEKPTVAGLAAEIDRLASNAAPAPRIGRSARRGKPFDLRRD